MLEELDLLVNLAHRDADWLEARRALEDIPARLAAVNRRLEEVKKAAAAAHQALEATRLLRRRREGETKDIEAEIRRFETQLLQIKTNEAYKAMLHEIEAARVRGSAAETAILELMDREEGETRELKSREAALARDTEALAVERRKLEEERARREARVKELEAARRELVEKLPPGTRSRYERVSQNKQGQAVALVTRASCGGCHANLPPQLLAEVRQGDAVRACEGCGRLLVWAGE